MYFEFFWTAIAYKKYNYKQDIKCTYICTTASTNPSACRYLNPCSYWAVGWFSAEYLNFEPNCGALYSKWYIFVNNRWISMKLVPKNSRTSNLFKYAIKSYVKNLAWCEMSWNSPQHKVQPDNQGTKTLSPSFCCVCSTPHTFLLAWPFSL